MANKEQEMQFWIAQYKARTGKKEVSMHEVADFMLNQGWPKPEPISPRDRLAKDLSRAARAEYIQDGVTGSSVRKNHALRYKQKDGTQLTLWVEIHDATRNQMLQSLTNRREQMVGDAYQLTMDSEYWNRRNQNEQPIQMEMDFTFDIELRRNAPPDEAA